ncbi:transcriptional regulator GcvA [Prosthecomicrobium sp. N25]|uniref:transcriptional regulator GcvA n=1 Tax=Prosthecomicrobium sp. N25 TaxID=3129254 RepID=UPI0030785BC7
MPPLPPLKALQAFEAAARHLSFKEAARELHVTPAAVSQQVRALEDRMGRPLFRRGTRAVSLTETGAAAAPVLRSAFLRMEEAARLMQTRPPERVLTVSVAPSFCARWLVPRLHRFRAAYPDCDLRLDATDALADFVDGGIDVALRYGRGRYPGLQSVLLREDEFLPVCAPSYLETVGPLEEPRDLARCTLIHLDWSMERAASPDWGAWLAAAGVSGADASRGPRFSADMMALQAAVDGQGVTLASRLLAKDDLRAERLVQLFPDRSATSSSFSLYLVFPSERREDPRVVAMLDWLQEEFARETV